MIPTEDVKIHIYRDIDAAFEDLREGVILTALQDLRYFRGLYMQKHSPHYFYLFSETVRSFTGGLRNWSKDYETLGLLRDEMLRKLCSKCPHYRVKYKNEDAIRILQKIYKLTERRKKQVEYKNILRIGQAARKWREAQNMTQTEAAEKAGVTFATVNNMECGRHFSSKYALYIMKNGGSLIDG